MSEPIYEKLIFENEEKGFQYRLVVSEFKDTEYLHLRKYFLSYDGLWVPSSEGASIPLSINSVVAILDGLVDICSNAESDSILKQYFTKKT